MPGSSTFCGFGTTTRSAKLPVVGIDGDVRERELAGHGRSRVPSSSRMRDRQVARARERACGQRAAQLEQLGRRLRDVDVHRIELLHGGDGRRLVRRDERTLGHRRLADAAADRRRDARVTEHDVGACDGGSRRLDVGFGLAQRGGRVFVVLLADRVDLDQLGAAARVQLRGEQRRFGARQAGLRALRRRRGRSRPRSGTAAGRP